MISRTLLVSLVWFGAAFQDAPTDWKSLKDPVKRLGSDDPEERLAARAALRAHPAKDAALALALNEADHAKAAAVALGVRGDERAMDELRKLTKGKASADRVAAIEAMRSLTPDAPLLVGLLLSDDFSISLAAARALGTFWEHRVVSKAVDEASEKNSNNDRRTTAGFRRGMVLYLAEGGARPFSRFDYWLNYVEDPALAGDFILALFQHEAPVTNAPIIDGLRGFLKRTDLSPVQLEMAGLALLKSNDVRMSDLVTLWSAKSARVVMHVTKRLESYAFQPERIEEWLVLLKAGGMPRDLETRIVEWLGKFTGVKASKVRAKDIEAWGAWYQGRKKRFHDEKIDAIIDKGVAWLKANGVAGEGRATRGLNALECYALLKCGASPEDPVLKPKLDALRKAAPSEVYDAALRVMVLAELLPYDAPAKGETVTSDPARDRLKASVSYLVRAQKRNGAWGYDFNGTGDRENPYWDNSNTQFALLGLRAGVNAGCDVPKETWTRAERHLVDTLLAGEKKDPKNGDVITGPAEKGWAYSDDRNDEPYWNMTCGGLSGLLICRATLSGKSAADHNRDADVTAAYKWLSNRYPLPTTEDPEECRLDLYGLWSMERACLIAGQKELARRDWYDDGCNLLVRTQEKDGSWSSWGIGINAGERFRSVPTCFALLFLRRAYVPVITRSAKSTPEPTK